MTTDQLLRTLRTLRALRDAGIATLKQAEFLLHLYHAPGPGLSCTELVRLLGLHHHGSVTMLCDRFVACGLIVRGHPEGNRKLVRVQLSRQGRSLMENAVRISTSGPDATPKR